MKTGYLFRDKVQIRMICADIPNTFRRLTSADISVFDINMESDISTVFTIKNKDISQTKKLLLKSGAEFEVLNQWGIGWLLYQVRCRMLLILGVVALTCLTVWIPTRIFFVNVQGNQRLPERLIVQTAENLGLKFGCSRSNIRSEAVKNLMIESIPELDWVGITTAGCVATVEVRENIDITNDITSDAGSIVADCDGIVKNITVIKGKAICQPGQVVQKGQVLISGYEDCGLVIQYTGAKGEIIADTFHSIQMKTPRLLLKRQECDQIKRTVSVRIGKKLINFVKDSGISPTGCVKMYLEKCLTLPGGFILPVALIQECYYSGITESVSLPEDTCSWLENSAKYYLNTQMTAGEVLRQNYRYDYINDVIVFRGEYFCTEQIGKYKFEEIPNYGKNS